MTNTLEAENVTSRDIFLQGHGQETFVMDCRFRDEGHWLSYDGSLEKCDILNSHRAISSENWEAKRKGKAFKNDKSIPLYQHFSSNVKIKSFYDYDTGLQSAPSYTLNIFK